MSCVDDSQMKPEITEDIQAVEWKNAPALKEALFNTYPSIRYVVQRYQSSFTPTNPSDTEESS